MLNDRPSRRRLKANFMRGKRVALQDVYERGLVEFVKRAGYDMDSSRFIRRHMRKCFFGAASASAS